MAYKRPKNPKPMSSQEKLRFLAEYIEHYRRLSLEDISVLNRKVPREYFSDLLNRIGEMLLTESAKLSASQGPVRIFLKDNSLPGTIEKSLPDEFRVFCLALNALKQWVAAEQAATDRYLLGGEARELCREVSKRCLVTDGPLDKESELHHPVRDGRPPILLTKEGHSILEDQVCTVHDDPLGKVLVAIRRQRNGSWAQLRRGCLDLLGKGNSWPSRASAASARAFARKVHMDAEVEYEKILAWLDLHGY